MSTGDMPGVRKGGLGGVRAARGASHARTCAFGPVSGPPEGRVGWWTTRQTLPPGLAGFPSARHDAGDCDVVHS